MGRLIDFGVRRLVGYILTWIVVLVLVALLYGRDGASPSLGAFVIIWLLAFLLSLHYTGKMKVRQRRRREWKAWRKAQRRAAAMARRQPPPLPAYGRPPPRRRP